MILSFFVSLQLVTPLIWCIQPHAIYMTILVLKLPFTFKTLGSSEGLLSKLKEISTPCTRRFAFDKRCRQVRCNLRACKDAVSLNTALSFLMSEFYSILSFFRFFWANDRLRYFYKQGLTTSCSIFISNLTTSFAAFCSSISSNRHAKVPGVFVWSSSFQRSLMSILDICNILPCLFFIKAVEATQTMEMGLSLHQMLL